MSMKESRVVTDSRSARRATCASSDGTAGKGAETIMDVSEAVDVPRWCEFGSWSTRPSFPAVRASLCAAALLLGSAAGAGAVEPLPGGSERGGGGNASASSANGGVNGDLRGRLISYVRARDALVSVDLRTGLVTTLSEEESSIPEFSFRPDHSNPDGGMGTIGRCRPSISPELVCVLTFDGDGRPVAGPGFTFHSVADAGLVGAAKRSWDGRFYAVKDDEDGGIGGGLDTVVALHDAQGRRLSRLNIGRYTSTEEPYDWLPSGELLVAHADDTSPASLMRTKPYATTPARRATLPVDGRIERVIVSPAGDKALLRLGDTEVPFGLLVLDLDTYKVSAPVYQDKPTGASIVSEAWSPDGQWLFLHLYARGKEGGAVSDGVATRAHTHVAVRIDGGAYPLIEYPPVSTDKVRVLLSESEDDRDGRLGVGRIPSDVKVWVE